MISSRRPSSHATGVTLVRSELERRGCTVRRAAPRSGANLVVTRPDGKEALVQVSSLWNAGNVWWPPKKEPNPSLLYILVALNPEPSRFFIMTQTEHDDLAEEYRLAHPRQKALGGFDWKAALPFENEWSKLGT